MTLLPSSIQIVYHSERVLDHDVTMVSLKPGCVLHFSFCIKPLSAQNHCGHRFVNLMTLWFKVVFSLYFMDSEICSLDFFFFCPFYHLSTNTTFPFSVLVVLLSFWHHTPITPQSLSPPFSLHLCLSLCKCACDWWLCPLVDKSHFSLQL